MSVVTPSPQAQQTIRAGLKEVVDVGRRILIVGCPPGTFDHWMERHPLLLFWPSTEKNNNDGSRVIPAEVGAVLQTNMLSNNLSVNVRRQSKERGLVCPADTFSPGTVRRLLEGIVDRPVNGRKREEPMPEQKPRLVRPDVPAQPATTPAEIDDDTRLLLSTIDETIAGLQLIRERVEQMGTRFAEVRGQLDTLETLKKLLR